MKNTQVEGMKQTPAGGANKPAYGQDILPTNEKTTGRLSSMLSSIKHIGRPSSGGKMPFGK